MAKEAFIEYLDRTGELRVCLAKEAAFFIFFIEYLGIQVQSDLNRTDDSVVYLSEESTM